MFYPRRVFFITLLLAVAASLLAGWHMLQMKQDALAYAQANGKNALLLVEHEFHRDLDVHAQTLRTLANRVNDPTAPPLTPQALRNLVQGHAAGSTTSGTLVLLDARGHLLADLNHPGAPDSDQSGHEYFQAPRDNPAGLSLSHPFTPGYPGSAPSTALSRAVLDSQGRFLGVVAAIKELQHMDAFVRGPELGKRGVVSIRLLDGTVLAQWPPTPARDNADEQQTFRSFVESGEVERSLQQPSGSDAYWRGYRRVGHYPVVVSVEQCREAVLNTWTGRTWVTTGLLLTFNTATLFFAFRLTHHLRRRDAKEERLRTAADTDPLTSLHNRRWFDEKAQLEWRRRRSGDGHLAVLMLDIDQFKAYNDHYGHPRGDLALINVAHLIGQGRRDNDGAARYGGEEFVVILPGCDTVAAERVAESIRRAVEETALPHAKGERGVVTISVGVASTSDTPADSVEALIAAADANLYKAKAAGRNKVVA
ncbi:diguanylate cyclase [Pseudomonas sp. NY15181]|uniref:sensor domain-containing diguanylate cyclase n=1 Tax=Pseudomonas sp. NY15181 TaxID=3400349 RepID=UPI003A86B83A